MKKKIFSCIVCSAILMASIPAGVKNNQIEVSAGIYSEVPDGYIGIYTIDDLYAVRNNTNGYYILMNDIDLSETAPGGDWDSGNGWEPIDGFSGTFDGNGYAIKNMNIYGTLNVNEKCVGLFGDSDVMVKQLGLVNCNIDVEVPENMRGEIFIGGITGASYHNSKNINKCYTTGNIKVNINCSDDNYSDYCIGGISGMSGVSNSFNSSNIYVSVKNDKTSLNADNENRFFVGGISGFCGLSKHSSSNYLKGQYVYNSGNIELEKEEAAAGEYLIGNIFSSCFNWSLSDSYYLKDASEYTASGDYIDSYYSNVKGLTKAQMRSYAAFTGFDFSETWTLSPNSEYPYPTLQEVPYVVSSSPETTTTTATTTMTTTTTTTATTTRLLATSTTYATQPAIKNTNPDVNGDGEINAADASLILAYYAYSSSGGKESFDVFIRDYVTD